MENSVKEVINLPSLCLEYKGKLNGYRLHEFQLKILERKDSYEKITFLHAHVGSGKTFLYYLIPKLMQQRVLLVLPTNALIEDIVHDAMNVLDKKEVVHITANVLDREAARTGEKRHIVLGKLLNSGRLVLTNPDILSYLIHGSYGKYSYTFDFQKVLRFDYYVFDEYHLMDEEQFSIVMAFIFSLYNELLDKSNLTPDSIEILTKLLLPNFIFSSGTPEWDYIKLIERLLGKKIIGNIDVNTKTCSPDMHSHSRIIQKSKTINVIDNNRGLLNFLLNENGDVRKDIIDFIEMNGPVLFIFDSIKDAVVFDDLLLNYYSKNEVGRNTGLETRSRDNSFSLDKVKKREYKTIITTSKIEVGVNYPVDNAFIESGFYPCNAIQRLGRVGRFDTNEESSRIFLVFSRRVKPINRIKILAMLKNKTNSLTNFCRKKSLCYILKSSIFHLGLLSESLKRDRKTSIKQLDFYFQKASKEFNCGKLKHIYSLENYLTNKCKIDSTMTNIKNIAEYFYSFRPPSFTKEIILETKRGKLTTEYDVIRALLRFNVEIQENRIIFSSLKERNIKEEDIFLRIKTPLLFRKEKVISYKKFREYNNQFEYYLNRRTITEDLIQIIKDYMTDISMLNQKCIETLAHDFPILFHPMRIKIIDVEIAY